MTINAFKDKIFPLHNSSDYAQYCSEEDISPRMSPDEDELPKSKSSTPNETLYDERYGVISDIDIKLDSELMKKYFSKGSLFELFKYLKSSYKKDFGSANRF